jgi:copper chaperone CopZ
MTTATYQVTGMTCAHAAALDEAGDYHLVR